jgi:hypothetical protein
VRKSFSRSARLRKDLQKSVKRIIIEEIAFEKFKRLARFSIGLPIFNRA